MKVGAGSQCVTIGLIHRWFDIGEVDATDRLLDMEITRHTIQSQPIPVKHTVCGVRVLLYFVDDEAGANGMKSSRRNEDRISTLGRNAMNNLVDATFLDGILEVGFSNAGLESHIELSTRGRVGNVPHFCFGFSAEL